MFSICFQKSLPSHVIITSWRLIHGCKTRRSRNQKVSTCDLSHRHVTRRRSILQWLINCLTSHDGHCDNTRNGCVWKHRQTSKTTCGHHLGKPIFVTTTITITKEIATEIRAKTMKSWLPLLCLSLAILSVVQCDESDAVQRQRLRHRRAADADHCPDDCREDCADGDDEEERISCRTTCRVSCRVMYRIAERVACRHERNELCYASCANAQNEITCRDECRQQSASDCSTKSTWWQWAEPNGPHTMPCVDIKGHCWWRYTPLTDRTLLRCWNTPCLTLVKLQAHWNMTSICQDNCLYYVWHFPLVFADFNRNFCVIQVRKCKSMCLFHSIAPTHYIA